MNVPATKWLLLVHQVPPKPNYLRAKVLRRLMQLGAIPLKNSAYLLPAGETTREDFEWLWREIVEQGGDAWILEGSMRAGLTDAELRDAFRRARGADFAQLAADARAVLEAARARTVDLIVVDTERKRLARRLAALIRIDFFDAPGREEVEVLMESIDRTLHPTREPAKSPERVLRGRTWMTRQGVKIDRIASAWLIRRFIDPAATFVFADPAATTHPPDVVRFDMFEGEFTHDGDLCTFEVLLRASTRPTDPALVALSQIVHDLDLKDDRHQRPETAGVGAMIQGLTSRHADDQRRIAEGATIFDSLYASLSSGGTA